MNRAFYTNTKRINDALLNQLLLIVNVSQHHLSSRVRNLPQKKKTIFMLY